MPNDNGQRVVGIDLDGTLLHYRSFLGQQELGNVIPAARDVVNMLKSANCYIIIHTSRITKDLEKEDLEDFKAILTHHLETEGVAFDEIWDKQGKPICDVMWDDRAITCDGRYDLAFDKIMRHKPWWEEMEGHLLV